MIFRSTAEKNPPCEVYVAPFDVLITDENETHNCKNIVQSDISVICDKNKLTDKSCTSAPDMIIEVVSPFNPANDYIRKLNIYAAPEAYTFNNIV